MSTSKSKSKRRVNAWYGWRPDRPDHRDFVFRPKALPAGPIPDVVDLRSLFAEIPPYDQGELGSCTANAIAAALEFDQRRQAEKEAATPSRLFIYYNERVMEGTISEDAGAEIRDGVKSVAQAGAPPEVSGQKSAVRGCWPYTVSKFKRKPTKACYAEARKHQAVVYERVNSNLQSMLECLASGFPFVFGFTCYDAFEGDEVAHTGVLDMPKPKEKSVGGHAVLCVGYDKTKQVFIVRNSWGTDWGQNGYFTMPFAYLTNGNLADDFWVIRTVE